MPYLKITCMVLETENYTNIAHALTDAVNDLFYNPKAHLTREELRERTTIHFTPYLENEFYIGGKTTSQRKQQDITIEISDWYMSVKQQKKLARELTPIVARLFSVADSQLDNINLRFYSYPPADFAVGGKLLSERIPAIGRFAKKWFG